MATHYSRRALLGGVATSTAVFGAGCLNQVLPDRDNSPEPITVSHVGITNSIDEEVEVAILLQSSDDVVVWESVELTQSGTDGSQGIIKGPWECIPGEHRLLTQLRPVEESVEIQGVKTVDLPVERTRYGACMSYFVSVTDSVGIQPSPASPPDGESAGCEPPSNGE